MGSLGGERNLRDEDPDHDALADTVGADEGEDEGRDHAHALGGEGPGAAPKRDDVAHAAAEEQRAPAERVDQPQPEQRTDCVDHPDADRRQQRRRVPEARQLEDAWGKVLMAATVPRQTTSAVTDRCWNLTSTALMPLSWLKNATQKASW